MPKSIDDYILDSVEAWPAHAEQADILWSRGLDARIMAPPWSVGYDADKKRVVIPIPGPAGTWANAKLWRKDGKPKILWHTKGAEATIFPLWAAESVDQRQVIICEGEWDCILLHLNGFLAITGTAGCTTWRDEWSELLANRDVAIVYDCDEAGREGAKKVAQSVLKYSERVKIVDLGLGDKQDITDWFVSGRTAADLQAHIDATEIVDQYREASIVDGVDAVNVDAKLKFRCIVVGKDLAPYQLPLKVTAKCIRSGGGDDTAEDSDKPRRNRKKGMCDTCALAGHDGISKTYGFDDRASLIKMANASDTQLKGQVRVDLGLPPAQLCRYPRVEIESYQNVEELNLVPEVEHSTDESKYALRRAFYFGKNLEANSSYLMRGTTIPDPNSQQGVFAVRRAEAVRDSISQFVLSPEVQEKLTVWVPPTYELEECETHISRICYDLERNVANIVGRYDVALGALLVMFSPLKFTFEGRSPEKGWLEAAIIGDTATGKTETVRALFRHARLGEYITSGENTTVAGILGGLQQSGSGRWTVTWGKLPLNDRGIVAIDEADNLAQKGIISDLSGVRSSGIAELVKVQTQRTHARTRILWIANPIHGRMREHNHGIEVVQDIFKDQQDMRRLDFVVGAAKEDVTADMINNELDQEPPPQVITSDVLHVAILRAWNLTGEQVVFDRSAEKLVRKYAAELGQVYAADIPLMLDAPLVYKLARMSASFATMLSATETVQVKDVHVELSVGFLRRLYDTATLGYLEYSKAKRIHQRVTGNGVSIDLIIKTAAHCDAMLSQNVFSSRDFGEILNLDEDACRTAIASLRQAGCIKKNYQWYKKSEGFRQWLVEHKRRLQGGTK